MAQEMNLWTRLTSDSPKFFKRVMNYAISLAATAGAVLALPATFHSIVLPHWIEIVCQNLIVAGGVAAAIAKTTMTDQAVQEANKEKVEKAIEKADVIAFEKPAAPNDKSIQP